VQARTQQPTAMGGQSRHLLVRTHGPNLAGAGRRRQGAGAVIRYNTHTNRVRTGKPGGNWPEQRGIGSYMPLRILPSIILGSVLAAAMPWQANTQDTAYQIVWVIIGEASSATDNGSAHAGRQLFMASDLVSKSLANVKIEQVDVTPSITQLNVGDRLCVSAMNIRALGPERELIGGAPLSISIRQDHKQRLGMSRSKRDICVRPNEPGEYPLRLTSMLPAKDGTIRGAQIFIRVSDPDAPAPAPDETTSAELL
jgi:hypothetical protein